MRSLNACPATRRAWLILSLIAFAPLVAGCGVTRMSRQQEIEVGQSVAAQIEQQYRTRQDATVSQIGQRIVSSSDVPDYPYRFRVVGQEEVNAFAVPGGPIYVTEGLLKEIGNDRTQLAGVLGHEIAHVTKRHSAKQIQRQNLLGLGIEILTEGTTADVATVAANIQLLSYSRDQERQADATGARYVKAAGYDPMGLVRFLERLAQMGGGGGSVSWLRSHPGSQARADRLRKMIRDGEI